MSKSSPKAKRSVRERPRPNFSRAVRLLIRDVARHLPEFAHVRAESVLVVAGEARRASRATIRPTRFADTATLRSKDGRHRKPRLSFRGRKILYVLTLRPLFFRTGGAEKRIETIIHELFHTSTRFDGTLAEERRHAVMGAEEFEAALRPLVRRFIAACPQEHIDRFAFDGEVRVRQWLEKPPRLMRIATAQRRHYDERHTFLGPVRMFTRQTRH